MSASYPQPLIEPDVDLRDFKEFPLEFEKLFASDTWIVCNPEEKIAALRLWCKSWHQEPCGSLPTNDRILSNLAGYGEAVSAWNKVKANAMRGWILCSDGRLYHPIVCEKATEKYKTKRNRHEENERDRARKSIKRNRVPAGKLGKDDHFPPENTPLSAGQSDNSGGQNDKSGDVSAGIPSENALKGREEIPEANASGHAEPIPDLVSAAKREFWSKAKTYLEKNGMSRNEAGSFLGMLRKKYSEEAVTAAIIRAEQVAPSEVKEFIIGILRSGYGKPTRNPSATADDAAAVRRGGLARAVMARHLDAGAHGPDGGAGAEPGSESRGRDAGAGETGGDRGSPGGNSSPVRPAEAHGLGAGRADLFGSAGEIPGLGDRGCAENGPAGSRVFPEASGDQEGDADSIPRDEFGADEAENGGDVRATAAANRVGRDMGLLE